MGTVRALAGIVVVSCLAALVTGTLILPGYGTMFGPMLMVLNILDHPALALGWFYALILAHMLIREYRSERRSVVGVAAIRGPLPTARRRGARTLRD